MPFTHIAFEHHPERLHRESLKQINKSDLMYFCSSWACNNDGEEDERQAAKDIFGKMQLNKNRACVFFVIKTGRMEWEEDREKSERQKRRNKREWREAKNKSMGKNQSTQFTIDLYFCLLIISSIASHLGNRADVNIQLEWQ